MKKRKRGRDGSWRSRFSPPQLAATLYLATLLTDTATGNDTEGTNKMAAKTEIKLKQYTTLKAAFKALEAGELPKKARFFMDGGSIYLEVPIEMEEGGEETHVFHETSDVELIEFLLKRLELKIKVEN